MVEGLEELVDGGEDGERIAGDVGLKGIRWEGWRRGGAGRRTIKRLRCHSPVQTAWSVGCGLPGRSIKLRRSACRSCDRRVFGLTGGVLWCRDGAGEILK